jgi:hypothetical protein
MYFVLVPAVGMIGFAGYLFLQLPRKHKDLWDTDSSD